MNVTERILVLGAGGQLGSELVDALCQQHGADNVWATDIRPLNTACPNQVLDAMDRDALQEILEREQITQVYHLAALLSAKGEDNPQLAWRLNMDSLLYVLELARETQVHRIFWPSSIAVFGPNTPRVNTPQQPFMDPNTMYGVTKLAGERLCAYYHHKYGLDVRSLRYPGLIGSKALPGGGTTDYAVDIFHQALDKGQYTSFLNANTRLPMLYMEDAVRATLELMQAPAEQIQVRDSYNLAGISFTPEELGEAIQAKMPEFMLDYAPDFREQIARSWPESIDDSAARADWGWAHKYGLEELVDVMFKELQSQRTQTASA